MERMVFFQGASYYDVFTHWIQELCGALAQQQIETTVVDLTDVMSIPCAIG